MTPKHPVARKPKAARAKKSVREKQPAYPAYPDLLSRITVNPRVLHGQACLRGLRIPVHLVVGLVASGMSFDEILDDYPDLERDDIRAALEYAAFVTRENIIPVPARTAA